MSNRSLVEFNHDYAYDIEKNPEEFVRALLLYLRTGEVEEEMRNYRMLFKGVRVFGMRHHSDGFAIQWGAHIATEQESPR